MNYKILFCLLGLLILPSVSAVWEADNNINSSLTGQTNPGPSIFQLDGTWYLFTSGSAVSGRALAYNWTGSAWQVDVNINASMPVMVGNRENFFFMDGTLYTITGSNTGNLSGFNWTGSAWQRDENINASFSYPHVGPHPTTFQLDGTWYTLVGSGGESTTDVYGFNWTGSAWQHDNNINSSVPFPNIPKPQVFFKDGTLYMLIGETDTIWGYNWTGSAWQYDSNINSSISGASGALIPLVFNMDGSLYLLIGETTSPDSILGFRWNETPNPTIPTLQTPTNTTSTTASNITINATSTTTGCFYWFNGSNLLANCDDPVNTSQLAGAWHLGEGNGNFWIENTNQTNDYSGNGNNGEVVNAEYVRGRLEKGMAFFGVDGGTGVDLPDGSTSLNITGTDISFGLWFYTEGQTGDRGTFLNYMSGGATDGYRVTIEATTNIPTCRVGNGTAIALTGTAVTLNQWNHIYCVKNSTTLAMYINGQLQTITPAAGNILEYAGTDKKIGARTSTDDEFNGTIDEVRIYNRSLSAAEILEDYNRAFGLFFWDFTGITNGSQQWTAQVSDSYTNSSRATAFQLNLIFSPDNCSSSANNLHIIQLNITNEKDLDAFIHGTITSSITITRQDSTTFDFAVQNNGSETGLDICVDEVWINSTLDADIIYHNEPNFETSNWYIRDLTIVENGPSRANMSLLNTSDVTAVTVFVLDESANLAPSRIVRAQRFNFDTNAWEVMRMGRTSVLGSTLLPLEALDAFYRFVITDDDGVQLKEFDEIVVTQTELTLLLDATVRGYYPETVGTASATCTYNNVTLNLTCTATDASGLAGGYRLDVWRAGALNWTIFCTDTEEAVTATLVCTLNNNDYFFYSVTVHFDDEWQVATGEIGSLVQQQTYGRTGFISGAFLTLTSGLIGAFAPTAVPIFIVGGFSLASFLDLLEPVSATTTILLAVIALIIVWRIRE